MERRAVLLGTVAVASLAGCLVETGADSQTESPGNESPNESVPETDDSSDETDEPTSSVDQSGGAGGQGGGGQGGQPPDGGGDDDDEWEEPTPEAQASSTFEVLPERESLELEIGHLSDADYVELRGDTAGNVTVGNESVSVDDLRLETGDRLTLETEAGIPENTTGVVELVAVREADEVETVINSARWDFR